MGGQELGRTATLMVAQNSSQHFEFGGRYNYFLSLDATIRLSKN